MTLGKYFLKRTERIEKLRMYKKRSWRKCELDDVE